VGGAIRIRRRPELFGVGKKPSDCGEEAIERHGENDTRRENTGSHARPIVQGSPLKIVIGF
jgi:hypothetical protein